MAPNEPGEHQPRRQREPGLTQTWKKENTRDIARTRRPASRPRSTRRDAKQPEEEASAKPGAEENLTEDANSSNCIQ